MFVVMSVSLLAALMMFLVQVLKGPTAFDRALAGSSLGTAIVLLLAVFGFLTGRPDFLDVCLTFTLLNIITTLAILKFWRYGDLSHVGEEEEE